MTSINTPTNSFFEVKDHTLSPTGCINILRCSRVSSNQSSSVKARRISDVWIPRMFQVLCCNKDWYACDTGNLPQNVCFVGSPPLMDPAILDSKLLLVILHVPTPGSTASQ